jgi:FdrA protein
MSEPVVLAVVRPQLYVDSVTLLQVSADVLGLGGVQEAALVMATDLNRDLLRASGLLVGDAAHAGANDLVIGVRADTEAAARAAVEHAEDRLAQRQSPSEAEARAPAPRSLRSARRMNPAANLAVISVPGPFAVGEARLALLEGMHVFLFSDNVSIAEEVALKRLARQRDLLLMGPDCGTAILSGVGLGFANVVRRGSIGVVGASGTGIQELISLVHQAGHGISHAIGTGSRDLRAAVGGAATLAALALLAEDPATDTIVLLSKPSDLEVSKAVLRALAETRKRGVAYIQSGPPSAPSADLVMPYGIARARNLAEAARLALGETTTMDEIDRRQPDDIGAPRSDRCLVRGLFCGGTLREEAAAMLGSEHQLDDFGDDRYTRGRAHPMIDPTLRNQAIVEAGEDPHVGVLLLDFVLGLGAHPDPVGAALPLIEQVLSAARASGRRLDIVAHVVGTDADPQGLARQEAALRSAGVRVCATNYAAARTAGALAAGAEASG